MGFIKKYRTRIAVTVALFVLFFLARFYNILSLPIFTDEAIYIRWSQIAKNDAAWRFISLTDGKQPMFVWLAIISMRFIKDPLLAGRTVSVFAGFASMIGLFFLGMEVFKNTKIGFISAFLYLIFPFALVYDRMALYDSLVGAFAVWALYFEVILVRKLRLDIALILGLVVGGGVLTKTSGFFYIYLLPVSLILFDLKDKALKSKLVKWVGLAIIVTGLGYLYYSILRLSPFFHIISDKNALFVYPLKEWIKHPFDFFIGNFFVGEWNWLYTYLTWPVLFLIPISFFINKQFLREKLLLFVWFLAPFTALALFGNAIYPRFIFFMTLSLLPLAAFTLSNLYKILPRKYLFVLLFLIFIFPLRSDFLILKDFGNAPIPISDLGQYKNSWPAGGGIKEAVVLFKEKSQNEKIFVATQGTFGLLPYAFEIYLNQDANILLKGYWPIGDQIPQEVLEASKKMPTYFVFYQPCIKCSRFADAPTSWPLSVVFREEKIPGEPHFTVYKVN